MKFFERGLLQLPAGLRSKITEPVPLEVAPNRLHGIEIGCVSRQLLDDKSGVARQQPADFWTAMHRPAIPNDQERAAKLSEQLPQEPGDRNVVEIVVDKGAEIESQALNLGRKSEGRDQRNLVASPTLVSDFVQKKWSLAFGGQGATHERRHEQAAFVDQN